MSFSMSEMEADPVALGYGHFNGECLCNETHWHNHKGFQDINGENTINPTKNDQRKL